jgi:hypothetical protein
MYTKQIEFFKDLDLSLSAHPLTGDITRKFNADAIKRALKTLMQLEKWDKPFDSDVYGFGEGMLFELPGPLAEISVKDRLAWMIKTFEPRVDVNEIEVNVSSDETSFDITISYTIKSLNTDDFTTFTIQRVR